MPKGWVILHCPLRNLESTIFLECTLHKPDKDKTRIVLALVKVYWFISFGVE